MFAKTIAVASGKGGVGKTYCSVNISKELSRLGKRVLLIDCDFNLSNCAIALGVKTNKTILDYYRGVPLEKCIVEVGGFDLLIGESGNLGVLNVDKFLPSLILEFLPKISKDYDYILFDMPAGLDLSILNLTSYCDYRFVVVNSAEFSITDSYALIKVLNQKYGVYENFILPNMISSEEGLIRLENKLKKVVNEFLEAKISFLPPINLVDSAFRPRIGDSKLEKFSGQKILIKLLIFFSIRLMKDRPNYFWKGKRQDVFFLD